MMCRPAFRRGLALGPSRVSCFDMATAMNPTWTREELILVYDFYLSRGRKGAGPNNPDLLALSRYLRSLPWHANHWRDAQFRNAGAILVKISQLRAYEQDLEPPSMSIHRGAQALAQEYRQQPEALHALAEALRASVAAQAEVMLNDLSESPPSIEDTSFREGTVQFTVHRRLERNRRAVIAKLAEVKQATGRLACEACGFDFEVAYGEVGRGFAECHHTVPLAQVGERNTKLANLAVVCANCHRMLHRGLEGGQCLTVAELQARLKMPR